MAQPWELVVAILIRKCQRPGYMASFLEIALLCNGYDPKGVEWPGEIGEGCYAAEVQFQKDGGYYGGVKAVCGYTTIKDLLNR